MTDRTELRRQIAEAIYIDSGRSFGWPTYAEALSGSPHDLAKYGRRDGVTAKAYAENSESNAAAIMGIIGPRLDQLDAAEAALARVRELHERHWDEADDGTSLWYCGHCQNDDGDGSWPCPTIAALGGES